MGLWADRMVDRLDSQDTWPAADDHRVWDQIRIFIGLLENDRAVIRNAARWRNAVREYRIDPLAPLISDAFTNAVYGSAPVTTSADPADQQRLDFLIAQNRLPRRWQRAHRRVSSEAEVWWRVTSNPSIDQCPQVTFHSRLDVIPTFTGNDQLRSVAFIDELYPLAGDTETTVWRHFEIIDDQDIVNVLYYGTEDTIGEQMPLEAHPETANLFDEVAHELPSMPAGRVQNREGSDIFYGVSDYAGIEDFLYDLNEILTIFQENVRLTLKKRAVVPASAVDESGTVDASQEIFVRAEPLSQQVGGGSGSSDGSEQFQVLQYVSDIEEVITAQNATAQNALLRVGITPAFVGMQGDQGEGRAITGTALRLKLTPTIMASDDRATGWDDENPVFVQLMQILDDRPPAQAGDAVLGGFGRGWTNPGTPPSIQRSSSLPQDPVEESEMHATRVTSGIESRRTAIGALHPDWSPDQVQEEIDAIDSDVQAKTPTASLLDSGSAPQPVRV